MDSIAFLEYENDGYSLQATFLPEKQPTRFMLFAVLRKNGKVVKQSKVLDMPYSDIDSGKVIRLTALLASFCQFFNHGGSEDEFFTIGKGFGKLASSLDLDFSGFVPFSEEPEVAIATIVEIADLLSFRKGNAEIVWEPGHTLEEFDCD